MMNPLRILLPAAALVAASAAFLSLGVSVSRAAGDAPWCAVISLGEGDVYWDCRYASVDACVPNVLAGNRGFCNVNPWPGPSTRPLPARSKHRGRPVSAS